MLVKQQLTMSSNCKGADLLQCTSPLTINFTAIEPSTVASNNSSRLVQAANRIEPQASSKPFYFDMFRLMSILYNQNQNIHQVHSSPSETVQTTKTKPLKIKNTDGILQCDSDPFGWTYRVRLAANCFEQNLIAVPVSSVDASLITAGLLSSTLASSSQQVRIVLRATKPIAPGEELAFWPSFDLNLALDIPFLSPSNIVNGTCYICTYCGKCYTQPNPLKIHLKFACPMATVNSSNLQCATSVPSTSSALGKSSQYLLTTVTAVNGAATFADKFCRLNATGNGNGQQHQLPSLVNFAHRPSKSLKKVNGKSVKHSLDGHRKLHNCSYCGKVYTRKYGLKIHIRTHTGLKPLSCRYCGRSFSDPSNLNKHVRLHTQQTPNSVKLIR